MAATYTQLQTLILLLFCGTAVYIDVGAQSVSVGCFGSAGFCLDHNLTCPGNTRVALDKALYGHKTEVRCTTGVIDCSDPCCSYLSSSDCFNTFTAVHVSDAYRNCTKNECHFRTPRLVEPCSRSDDVFQRISSYSVVEYECVDDSTILPLCSNITSTFGTSVSVLYDPARQYKQSSDVCWCNVYHGSATSMRVEGIDMRLGGTGCGSMYLYNSRSTVTRDCNSPPIWPNLTVMNSTDAYTVLQLNGTAEFVWLRFTAAAPLSVTCSINAQHTTTMPPTTTSTTTTPTSTTTTKTVTYQTPRPPPVGTSAESPQTASSALMTSTTASITSTPLTATLSRDASTSSSEHSAPTVSPDPTDPATSTEDTGVGTEAGDVRETTDSQTGGDNTLVAAVGGAVAGAVALIVIVVLVVWCRSKHSSGNMENGQTAVYKDPAGVAAANPAFTDVGKPVTNNTSDTTDLPKTTVLVDNGVNTPPQPDAVVVSPSNQSGGTEGMGKQDTGIDINTAREPSSSAGAPGVTVEPAADSQTMIRL